MARLLISTGELADHPAPDLCLIDARPAAAFAMGHIPGAVHFDPFGLSLRDTRPEPLAAYEWMVQHVLELRGVRRERPVVVYEENSGMCAARVLWFLRLFGHPDARLLDGGIGCWRAAARPLTRDAVDPEPTVLVVERHPEVVATVDDVRAALDRPGVKIVDARSRAEHTGELVRAARGGAIPRAIHVEWTRNLAPDGRYLPSDEIRAMYCTVGVTPDDEVITYCQGGYRAAQSQIALELAGYRRVRSYLGSWNEWGNRLDLPIAR